MEVPCGDCVGCCVSSYSILVRPEDAQALSTIPAGLLADASALGSGVKAMGHLPDGTCPMLHAGKCSIYAHRPQTCRDYDCRIFTAAGIEAQDKTAINKRVREWRFIYETESDRVAHRAVQAAATFIREQGERLPDKRFPKNSSGIAVLAVKSYRVFLQQRSEQQSDAEIAAAIIDCCREFDAGSC